MCDLISKSRSFLVNRFFFSAFVVVDITRYFFFKLHIFGHLPTSSISTLIFACIHVSTRTNYGIVYNHLPRGGIRISLI